MGYIHVILITLFVIKSTNAIETNNEQSQKRSGSIEKPATAEVIFGGDVSFDYPIRTDNGNACSYPGLLKGIARYFRNVDYNMVNFEAPFVTRNISSNSKQKNKAVYNKAWPKAVIGLTKVGIHAVTIANNHLTDFGGVGAIFTNYILTQNNIDVVGLTYGERKPYSNQVPILQNLNGIKVGFLAYCSLPECSKFRRNQKAGPALLDKDVYEKDIKLLKPQVDVIIIYIHWGVEYKLIPDQVQREMSIKLSKLGVDLIIGSHTHALQGNEWINKTLVKYSLGNLLYHPHFVVMGKNGGGSDQGNATHEKYMALSKNSRGPVKKTELFKVVLTKNGVLNGYYLPVRIHVDNATLCPYPKAKNENDWKKICGPEDENCFVPRDD